MFWLTKQLVGCIVAIGLAILALFLLFALANWIAQPRGKSPKGPPVLRTTRPSPIPSEVEIEGRTYRSGPIRNTPPGQGMVAREEKVAHSHDRVIAGQEAGVVWSTAGPTRGAWKWGVLDATQQRVVESYPMGTTARVKTDGTITVFLSSGSAEPYTMWFRITR